MSGLNSTFWQSCSLAGRPHAAFSHCHLVFRSVRISVLGFLQEQQTFRRLKRTYSICTHGLSEFYSSRKSLQMISIRQSTFRRMKKPEICLGWGQAMQGGVHSTCVAVLLMPSSPQAKKTQRQRQHDRLRAPHTHAPLEKYDSVPQASMSQWHTHWFPTRETRSI